jgi:hypothetical protein
MDVYGFRVKLKSIFYKKKKKKTLTVIEAFTNVSPNSLYREIRS